MVKRGEIRWVDFAKVPGRPLQKKRPALVVQNDLGNKYSGKAIVVAIRSDPRKPLPVLAPLPAGTAGLRKDSVADCGLIATIPQDLLGDKLGVLPAAHMKRVEQALKLSVGLR